MKAKEYARQSYSFGDGSVVSVVIWTLPKKDRDRPHGFKYRLQYTGSNGETLVRYDNERPKGDHKHIGDTESAYQFVSVDKLLDDFWRDVDEVRSKKNK